jgi:hypothetical protein
MSGIRTRLAIAFVIVAGLIYGLEYFLPAAQGGSLLFNMLFWLAIVEGSVAVAAVGEVTNAKWVKPYRQELGSVYPLILLFGLLFIIYIPRLAHYPWTEQPGIWLNRNLFIARHIIQLIAVFFIARRFARESINDGPKRAFWGVVYLLAFVISMTGVAFDWLMSLEYPWVSTLFGALFFIEAFYCALALAGIFTFVYRSKLLEAYGENFESARRDVATLLFAFAIFWASQFYTQYLVIWYGNIPEEVSLIYYRTIHSPMREFFYSVIAFNFIIPFITFTYRRMKANYIVFLIISIIVWLGIAVERLVVIVPRLSINPLILIVEFIIIGLAIIYVIRKRESFLAKPS